jgi:WD40 repeat protein
MRCRTWILAAAFASLTLVSGAQERPIPQMVLQAGHADTITSMAFSPDGRTLASGSNDNSVAIWEIATGRQIARLWGNLGAIEQVKFTADGRFLISGGFGEDGLVVWNTSDWSRKTNLRVDVTSFAISRDGTKVACSTDILEGSEKEPKLRSIIGIYGLPNGELKYTLEVHGWYTKSLQFSPDASSILFLRNDGYDNTELYSIAAQPGSEAGPLPLPGVKAVHAIDFSPDGHRLYTGLSDGRLIAWRWPAKEILFSVQAHALSVESLVAGAGATAIMSIGRESGEAFQTGGEWSVRSVSTNGTLLGIVRSIDYDLAAALGTGELSAIARSNTIEVSTNIGKQPFKGYGETVTGIAFSPDSKTFAVLTHMEFGHSSDDLRV